MALAVNSSHPADTDCTPSKKQWASSQRALISAKSSYTHCVKLHLRHRRTEDEQRGASLCPLCLSGASILCGERTEMLHRNLMGGGDWNPGSTNKYTKFSQLIIRKLIKITANIYHILRLKCTKLDSRRLSVRSSLRWSLTHCGPSDTLRPPKWPILCRVGR